MRSDGATTIHQIEALPAAYPVVGGLSTEAAALADAAWQRLEGFIAWRFSERAVEWIAEGPGHWEPPLAPAAVTLAEIWRDEAWEETTLPASPLGGFRLDGCGPYRFTATVGDDEAPLPEAVREAFVRLAEYMAAPVGKAGVMSESVTAGSVSISTRHHEAAAARAIHNSGAGDLLRPYRRA